MRRMEDRFQEKRRALKRRMAAHAAERSEKRRKRLSTFSAALRSGDPLHADKFERIGASEAKDVETPSRPNPLSGRLSVLKPRGGRHEYTIVYMHQFALNGAGYIDWGTHYFFNQKLAKMRLKVVLPTARAIPISAHNGNVQYAWYDYRVDYDGAREDVLNHLSLRRTRDRIFKILDREIKLLGGDARRVFLGGASQGCCTGLHCALTYPRLLGGFVGTVGHLMSCTPTPERKMNMPIYMYNGSADEVMRWPWVSQTYNRFKDAGYTDVHIKKDIGVTHENPDEKRWILHFLNSMIKR